MGILMQSFDYFMKEKRVPKKQTKKTQSVIKPEKILDMQREGNSRFVQNQRSDWYLLQHRSIPVKASIVIFKKQLGGSSYASLRASF
jgi:hypothetical protein